MNLLWLALHLPHLPLEASAPSPSPSAIVERGRVLCADAAARQAGIVSGTGAAAARVLAPAITLTGRDPEREADALHRLACWAGSLTPRISLTPDTLLLEIGGCLRLFGGLEKLVSAAQEGVHTQGFSVGIAVAPTPLAAEWLARSTTAALCRDADTVRRQLEDLPISTLPDKAAATLARFGLRTLADVRRLPGAELARRIGRESLQRLARAFGEIPDPRADFVFPERFVLPLQLPAAVDNASALLFAARRLTAALAGWLAARQSGVREITLRLQQRHAESLLVLQFAELTADAERFERVLRERLENTSLDAPVEALRLEATHVDALPGRNRPLFADAHTAHDAIGALLERLSARLGEDQVYRLRLHDDHRPECATRRAKLLAGNAGSTAKITSGRNETAPLPRPLWLLATPEALAEVDGRPYRHGHLKLLSGPERIESGWWEKNEIREETRSEATGDIRRDYFIALSANACWLWIYRECRAPGGWFLHGYFS